MHVILLLGNRINNNIVLLNNALYCNIYDIEIVWVAAREKGFIRAYADSEGPDQTARPRSLISAFAARLQNRWTLQNIRTNDKAIYKTAVSLTDLILYCSHILRRHLFL